MDGTLYVVATPIGNLEEMSPRAIKTLREVSIIACEDTRETMKLCTHFDIDTPLISCHEHNEFYVSDKIVEILKRGENVAIVTDAGYPGISDPGSKVVAKCAEHHIKVEVVSGPCAIINAVVASALDTSHFFFYGFLPPKKGERRKELEKLQKFENTMVFYEAPHRIEEMLEDLKEVLGDRRISISRELTKKFEEHIRGNVSIILEQIKQTPIKGEMVVVVEGAEKEERPTLSDSEIMNKVNELIKQGLSASDAIKRVSIDNNIKKNRVYSIFHQ